MTKYRYTDEELATAVAESVSIAGVMRALGVRPAGGSHFNISRRIKRAGLDTSHFLGRASNKGQRFEKLQAGQILIRRDPNLPRTKPRLLRRALIEIGTPSECSNCRASEIWMGKALVLHVDHVDGDAWNNEAENLRFLCPNCHSQTATYCRKMSARNLDDQVLD
jgi:hypothetical protein